MVLIGYSGHSYVIYGILASSGHKTIGYCDKEEKAYNPFSLAYFGKESSPAGLKALREHGFFIAIGNNHIRGNIYKTLTGYELFPSNAIHAKSIIDPSVQLAKNGIMIAANATINPLASIGTGAICNTGSIIEHECIVGNFAHIAPGAVLCGNVKVGENSFIGAQSVIREGITIGNNVTVGAGSVVVKDVPDNVKILGNPARLFS